MAAGELQQIFRQALAHHRAGEITQAEALYRDFISRDPSFPQVYFNLGIILRIRGRYEEAIAEYQRALALDPGSAEAWNNLGVVQRAMGKLDEAIASFGRALECKRDYVDALNNLGAALKDAGQIEESLQQLKHAVTLQPDNAAIHSNWVYAQHYHPKCGPQMLLRAARQWNDRHAAKFLSPVEAHDVDRPRARSIDRRLRVGYVSANFREHCQAMFTIPLFAHHDRSRFEIFCYSDVISPDAITQRLVAMSDHWRETAAMNDEQLADLIRKDRIDVLIDLTLHMAGNRLLVFARKPAPVQITWLGYPGTTGLETIDARLSDPFLDPPGRHDDHYTERTIRLPHTFWCYDPLTTEPSVSELPFLRNAFVTFGCLNNFCKVNDGVLQLWSAVLRAVPDSKLILLSPPGKSRTRIIDQLGVGRDRISFVEFQPRAEYLKVYHCIDLCLDTFPYNGHTTTLDALWMSVPVVSLCGEIAIARAGLSMLSNVGLADLVANDPANFVRIAVDLAKDVQRLESIRATLRETMQRSPLMNATQFARGIENIYRQLLCEDQS
jgi:predicted O-linked N-acetylglucosamine transferase (SPINDLY family)